MRRTAIDLARGFTAALLSTLPGAWLLGSMSNSLGGWILGGLAALPFVAAGLLLAAPAMLALRRAGRNSALNYLLLGAGSGVLVESMLEVAIAVGTPYSPLQLGGAWGAAVGLWSSAMWCLIFRDRPRSFGRGSAAPGSTPGTGGPAEAAGLLRR
ncbi:MAG TPA: hypothetical protein VF547_01315 [Allosphingosinicella sp.]|jgi:hypothetical protein